MFQIKWFHIYFLTSNRAQRSPYICPYIFRLEDFSLNATSLQIPKCTWRYSHGNFLETFINLFNHLSKTLWGGVQNSCLTTNKLSWRNKWPRDQGGQWLFWRHIKTFHGCKGQLGYWWRNLGCQRHKRWLVCRFWNQ